MFTKAYWRWSAGVQLARLPGGMAPLAFTTAAVAVSGSYRLGGVLTAAYVVAEMGGAVPVGRVLDRVGAARGLRALLVLVAAGLAAVGVAAAAGVKESVLLVLVVVPGVVGGGLAGGFRALLAGVVDEAQLTRAVAVDAMILDGVLVAGPVLVGVASLSGPFVPLFAMAFAAAGAVWLVPGFEAVKREAERDAGSGDEVAQSSADAGVAREGAVGPASAPTPTPGSRNAKRTNGSAEFPPGLPEHKARRPKVPIKACLPWLGCQFTIGLLLSTIEVAPLPLVERLGAPASAAPGVVAVLCGASVAGSALYAWRGRDRGARTFLACFVVGGTLVAANLGWSGLVVGVVLVGSATGPLVTIASVNMQRLLPEARRSEGFSVSFTVQSAGFGAGALAVGVLPLWLAPLFGVVAAASIGWFVHRPAALSPGRAPVRC
ncbi:MFS transporter [Amycolatopsis rhabdoformis]|uniref:MFS transporter n=1 Tax=Amycolatopsis rhabdoformis TaxID=1448059 RepID=A0ABZ1I298_9PSEU|nr:MFS transporter [Amycolatopsis rhabdoformis]WSE28056.1 MFS transporter [Amycolatopsis rhabdoformis]